MKDSNFIQVFVCLCEKHKVALIPSKFTCTQDTRKMANDSFLNAAFSVAVIVWQHFFFSLSEEIRLFDLINVQQWTPAYTDLIWFIYLIIYILSLYEILLCACTFVKLFSWSINPAKETRFVVYILQKSDNTPVSLSKTISVPVGYSVGKCSERNLPWVVACRVPPTHNHQPCSIIRHAAVGRLLFWQDKSALSACCLSRLAAQQVYGVLRSWLFPFGSADYILVNWPDF